MIKLIINLCFKIKALDSFMERLVTAYLAKKNITQIDQERQKRFLVEVCQRDLERINKYERLGDASGVPAPKVYPKPKPRT